MPLLATSPISRMNLAAIALGTLTWMLIDFVARKALNRKPLLPEVRNRRILLFSVNLSLLIIALLALASLIQE
jgi:hypothetical protein